MDLNNNELESYFVKIFDSFQNKDLDFFIKGLRYSFFSGGKRLRPQLMCAVGKDLNLPPRSLYPAALALELIHTYSLVHDDLPEMDNDIYRRGKLTHHAKYGAANAVLAGDSFLTYAFEHLAENYSGRILKNLILDLTKASGFTGMVGGQALDCLTAERSVEIFEKIHRLKTGMLFGFSICAPYTIAECPTEQIKNMNKLGQDIGVIFQMQDDLFDKSKQKERAEENILSLLSEKELKEEIDKRQNQIKSFFKEHKVNKDSELYEKVQFLFKRSY